MIHSYSTAASVHQAINYPVLVAFDSGNLPPVAAALRAAAPDVFIAICGDDDRERKGNPGRTKAVEAAAVAGGVSVFPEFSSTGAAE